MKKEIDFKEIHLSMPDFVDNESFEYLLEEFDIYRNESNQYDSITLTVTKVEVS
jgi:hypothetical protein